MMPVVGGNRVVVRRLLAVVALLAVLVGVPLGVAAPGAGAAPAAGTPTADPTSAPTPGAETPPDAGCAAVALFAVPASGETTAEADPAVPVGLLAGLTMPLAQRWGDRLHVEYVPYPASIDRPLPYPISQGQGVAALEAAMTSYGDRCPAALLTVVGFSQGADVASDLVHRSTNDATTLSPDRFAGVVLLGNPRRDPATPNLVEAPGRGILGPRPTRELDVVVGRVYEVCAPGDPVCATDTLSFGALREGLASGAHRSYATLPVGPDGTPLFTVLGTGIDVLVGAASGTSPVTTMSR